MVSPRVVRSQPVPGCCERKWGLERSHAQASRRQIPSENPPKMNSVRNNVQITKTGWNDEFCTFYGFKMCRSAHFEPFSRNYPCFRKFLIVGWDRHSEFALVREENLPCGFQYACFSSIGDDNLGIGATELLA